MRVIVCENYKEIWELFHREHQENTENDLMEDYFLFQSDYPLLKGKPFEPDILALCMLLSDYIIIFPKNTNKMKFIKLMKHLVECNMKKLLFKIDEPFDYSEFANFIYEYFLVIYKFFKEKGKILLDILKELAPNLDLQFYSKIVTKVEKCDEIIKSSFGPTHYKHDENMKEIANRFYYVMILIYIKKRYEKDNPYLVPFLLTHLINFDFLKNTGEIIEIFNDNLITNNIEKVLDNFIFEEFSANNEKFKAADYLKNNQEIISKNLKNIKKFKNMGYDNCIKFIKPYLNGYVYLKQNNLEFNFNDFKLYWKNPKVLPSLIFHLDLSKKADEKEFGDDNYKFVIEKIQHCFSLFSFLDTAPDKLNKNIFNNFISIIERLMEDSKE